jgi:hypothetical protein
MKTKTPRAADARKFNRMFSELGQQVVLGAGSVVKRDGQAEVRVLLEQSGKSIKVLKITAHRLFFRRKTPK